MDLASKQSIQNLLKKRGLRPLKRFGQNFLIDEGVIKKIIEVADLKPTDVVLEIGPGIGAITQELAQRTQRVIAIEKDRNMSAILSETLKEYDNVKIISGDILKLDLSNPKFEARNSKQAQNSNDRNSKPRLEYLNFKNLNLFRISDLEFRVFKIAANMPYYITAPTIRKFLESPIQPKLMVLVVQKEVAQRICAKPPKMSILSNSVQFYADAEIVSYIPKGSFWPEPEVDAAIIKIVPNSQLARTVLANLFFKIMKAGFSHPRKQLLNNLSQGLKKSREDVTAWLRKNSIDPTRRAETLTVDDWINLTKSFALPR